MTNLEYNEMSCCISNKLFELDRDNSIGMNDEEYD